jgi:hypothetical protein
VSRSGGSRLGITVAAGLVLAALLAIPQSASAAVVATSLTGSGDGTILSTTATCPKGKRATGGGFNQLDHGKGVVGESTVPFAVVYESRKVGQSAWLVSGQITDPRKTGEEVTLIAVAYCRSKKKQGAEKTTEVARTVVSGGNGQSTMLWTNDAVCPKGFHAKAGGFSNPLPDPSGSTFPNNTSPTLFVGSSVLVAANGGVSGAGGAGTPHGHRSSLSTDVPGIPFTSYVYCAEVGKVIPGFQDGTNSGDDQLVTRGSGKCKKKRPVAGGFYQTGPSFAPGGGYYTEFVKSVTSFDGTEWGVQAVHHGPASTGLAAFIYCA